MNIEILRKQPTYALKNMIKALSQPISSFLNTDEDNERLENAKKVIKERKRNNLDFNIHRLCNRINSNCILWNNGNNGNQ